jgi:hypothetical protein
MPLIPGATNALYELQPEDVGFTLHCRVTATNLIGSASANSNMTGPISAAGPAPEPPSNSIAPAITPTTTVEGTVYTVTDGTWAGTPAPTFTRQWKSDADNVGDGSTSYTTVAGDLGKTITCVVTATNIAGVVSATSNSVGPITAASAYVGPGNVLGGATSYYGLRGYNAAYATGSNNALDLHDSTTGAFVASIKILADGSLDVATAATHIGAGASKVGKLYDQVGTNHLVQATAANMPTLALSAIGTRPALVFNGTSTRLVAVAGVTRPQPLTASIYYNCTDGLSPAIVQRPLQADSVIFDTDNGQPIGGPQAPSMSAGGTPLGVYPVSINTWHGVQCVFSGAASDFNFDGVVKTGDAGTDGASGGNPVLGCNVFENGNWFYGKITELGVWPLAFSPANSTAMYTNQAAWWV